jgi:hypothetical protein
MALPSATPHSLSMGWGVKAKRIAALRVALIGKIQRLEDWRLQRINLRTDEVHRIAREIAEDERLLRYLGSVPRLGGQKQKRAGT